MYLLFQSLIPTDTFLFSCLRLGKLTDVRFGKLEYGNIMPAALRLMRGAQVIETREDIDRSGKILDCIQNDGLPLRPDETFIFYNLRYFPIDLQQLEIVLAKALASDRAVILSPPGHAQRSPFAVVGKLKHLLEGGDRDQFFHTFSSLLRVDQTENFVVDLFDAGSLLNLFASNLELRHFNNLQSQGVYYVKSSPDRTKMQAEHRYFELAPPSIRPFLPQTGDFQQTDSGASYQIEKVYMIDSARLLANHVFNRKDVLNSFFERLAEFIRRCPSKTVSRSEWRTAMTKLLVDKTKKRLEKIHNLPEYDHLNNFVRLMRYESIDGFAKELISAVVEWITSSKHETLVYSHGDLSLANILYDRNSERIKVIDPRGISCEGTDAYQPVHYDLAKLSHCLMGFYDLIVFEMVDLSLDEDCRPQLKFKIGKDYQQLIEETFQSFLVPFGESLATIRLLEATLFLSMIPLHSDCVRRMSFQLLQAVRAYEDAMSRLNKGAHAKRFKNRNVYELRDLCRW